MNISQSVERILASKKLLGESFYGIFWKRTPEVQQYFEGVNMERQSVVLTMALIVVEQFYSNPYPATERYLEYLGTRHHERQIPLELYGPWSEAMLETLASFHGNDWNPDVAAQWKSAIERTVHVMRRGYESHYRV